MRLKHLGAPKLTVIAPHYGFPIRVNPNHPAGWKYRPTKGWIKQ